MQSVILWYFVEDTECEEEQRVTDADAVADNNQVLQLTIHRTDKLKSNLYIAHPVVRVHIVNLDTGNCVKKQNKCVLIVVAELCSDFC